MQIILLKEHAHSCAHIICLVFLLQMQLVVTSEFVKSKNCSRDFRFLTDTVEICHVCVGDMELEYGNMNKY